MLPEFPQLPETRVARQIECVSCRHFFTVSEDIPNPPGLRSNNWIRVPDERSFIQFHFREDSSQQRMRPEADTYPIEQGLADTWIPNHFHSIVCPRCGADNRNWATINQQAKQWWKMTPVIIGIALTIIISALALRLMIANDIPVQYQAILLFVLLAFAGIAPTILTKEWRKFFRHLQIKKSLPNSLQGLQNISPPTRNVVTIYLIILVVLPFLIFILFPWAGFQARNWIKPPEQNQIQSRVDEVLKVLPEFQTSIDSGTIPQSAVVGIQQLRNVVNEVEQTCNLMPVSNMIASLQSMQTVTIDNERANNIQLTLTKLRTLYSNYNTFCQQDLVDSAIISINELRKYEDENCLENNAAACLQRDFLDAQIAELSSLNPYITDERPLTSVETTNDWINVFQRLRPITSNIPNEAIENRIENNLIAIEKFLGTAPVTWFRASTSFLEIWLLTVGLGGLIVIITSITAASNYAKWVSRHVPRPIFHNLTNMTRVVMWEAKRVLVTQVDFQLIQWMRAERNDIGGIELNGLHRGFPIYDENGVPSEDKILAQRYYIFSDKWGKIVSADIHDVMAPQTISTPMYAAPSEAWPQNNIPLPEELLNRGRERENIVIQTPPPPSSHTSSTSTNNPPTSSRVYDQSTTNTDQSDNFTPLRFWIEEPGAINEPDFDNNTQQTPGLTQNWPNREHSQRQPGKIYTRSESPMSLGDLKKLMHLINDYYSLPEIRMLCFELEISFDNLPGEIKMDKSRELVIYCKRHGTLFDLLKKCKTDRKNIQWPTIKPVRPHS